MDNKETPTNQPETQPAAPVTPDQPATPAAPAPAASTATPQPNLVVDDPGKTLSIVGLVMAFVIPLVGLVLSIIGRNKSKKAGLSTTLGTVGIILNSVFMVLGFLYFILVFVGTYAAISEKAEAEANGTTDSSIQSDITE